MERALAIHTRQGLNSSAETLGSPPSGGTISAVSYVGNRLIAHKRPLSSLALPFYALIPSLQINKKRKSPTAANPFQHPRNKSTLAQQTKHGTFSLSLSRARSRVFFFASPPSA